MAIFGAYQISQEPYGVLSHHYQLAVANVDQCVEIFIKYLSSEPKYSKGDVGLSIDLFDICTRLVSAGNRTQALLDLMPVKVKGIKFQMT